jgi:hypothetical protein
MHVATTRRVYKGKIYVTHLLRRSIRSGKTVTHETLGNLSHLPDRLIEIIKRSLKGETRGYATSPAWRPGTPGLRSGSPGGWTMTPPAPWCGSRTATARPSGTPAPFMPGRSAVRWRNCAGSP